MCLSVQLISFPYLDAHIQTKQLTTHCDSTFHTPALNVQFGRSAISQICIDRFLFFFYPDSPCTFRVVLNHPIIQRVSGLNFKHSTI